VYRQTWKYLSISTDLCWFIEEFLESADIFHYRREWCRRAVDLVLDNPSWKGPTFIRMKAVRPTCIVIGAVSSHQGQVAVHRTGRPPVFVIGCHFRLTGNRSSTVWTAWIISNLSAPATALSMMTSKLAADQTDQWPAGCRVGLGTGLDWRQNIGLQSDRQWAIQWQQCWKLDRRDACKNDRSSRSPCSLCTILPSISLSVIFSAWKCWRWICFIHQSSKYRRRVIISFTRESLIHLSLKYLKYFSIYLFSIRWFLNCDVMQLFYGVRRPYTEEPLLARQYGPESHSTGTKDYRYVLLCQMWTFTLITRHTNTYTV